MRRIFIYLLHFCSYSLGYELTVGRAYNQSRKIKLQNVKIHLRAITVTDE